MNLMLVRPARIGLKKTRMANFTGKAVLTTVLPMVWVDWDGGASL